MDKTNPEHASNKEEVNNSSNEDIMNQAEDTAIQYFKDEYKLDVEITNKEMMPSIVADKVNLEGFVVGHPEQTFKISVNYHTQETSNFVMNAELRKAIKSN